MTHWESLDDKWQEKLQSSKFVVKDCKGDGNCQFRSIAQALQDVLDHEQLRILVYKYMNKMSSDEFNTILDNYKIEKQIGEFYGNWDPYKIRNKSELAEKVLALGNGYQGDYVTLSILSKMLRTTFIILDSSYNIIKLGNKTDKYAVMLYYRQSGHYKTVGLRKNKVIESVFKSSNLPVEVKRIVDKEAPQQRQQSPKSRNASKRKTKRKSPKRKNASKRKTKSPKPKSKRKSPKASQLGGFDKKLAKLPRKMSKKYCMKTHCKQMGFSQKASCRYYKNCY